MVSEYDRMAEPCGVYYSGIGHGNKDKPDSRQGSICAYSCGIEHSE